MNVFFRIVKWLILIIGVIAGGASYYAYKIIWSSNVHTDYELFIPSGSTYEEVQVLVEKAGILHNVRHFYWVAEQMNYPNHIYAGRYLVSSGMSNRKFVQLLRGGMQTPVHVVINNVNFKEDLAQRIASQLEIDSTEVMYFLTDEEQLDSLGYTVDDILCYFIPNTYEMYWNTGLEAFVKRMLDEYDAFWTEARKEKARLLALSPEEVITLASIVEKEYKHPEERSRIAGVYINRIESGMKLQADPTVKYALGDLSIRRVLKVHTEIDDPYNTYYYSGLPPGPICLPETSTIDAVLNAEEHDYLYFCAKFDLSGYHEFNKTYSEHISDATLYQQALNKLNIYE